MENDPYPWSPRSTNKIRTIVTPFVNGQIENVENGCRRANTIRHDMLFHLLFERDGSIP